MKIARDVQKGRRVARWARTLGVADRRRSAVLLDAVDITVATGGNVGSRKRLDGVIASAARLARRGALAKAPVSGMSRKGRPSAGGKRGALDSMTRKIANSSRISRCVGQSVTSILEPIMIIVIGGNRRHRHLRCTAAVLG